MSRAEQLKRVEVESQREAFLQSVAESSAKTLDDALGIATCHARLASPAIEKEQKDPLNVLLAQAKTIKERLMKEINDLAELSYDFRSPLSPACYIEIKDAEKVIGNSVKTALGVIEIGKKPLGLDATEAGSDEYYEKCKKLTDSLILNVAGEKERVTGSLRII